jgi:hypothetical protein
MLNKLKDKKDRGLPLTKEEEQLLDILRNKYEPEEYKELKLLDKLRNIKDKRELTEDESLIYNKLTKKFDPKRKKELDVLEKLKIKKLKGIPLTIEEEELLKKLERK